MRRTSESSYQLQTIFGSSYIPEQRSDETRRHLPAFDDRQPGMNFDDVLKVLRKALSLR